MHACIKGYIRPTVNKTSFYDALHVQLNVVWVIFSTSGFMCLDLCATPLLQHFPFLYFLTPRRVFSTRLQRQWRGLQGIWSFRQPIESIIVDTLLFVIADAPRFSVP
ncbi:Citrinin biosynthesis transcriptional activator ctnR [Fusarium oxysporum f. sp. albedinis]|nr:Uncharacterized protein HZ326_25180 [Fusarium oxysporum f. sp. albedinis]KAJ0132348.1 Citrinin biosynthesis transcriptional activator ctnR [Fusarium oxysporum f. sp. albedinis]